MWISQAHVGDAGLLYAYTDREKGNKGMTAFIIEPKNAKGCIARPIETKARPEVARPPGEFAFDGIERCQGERARQAGPGFQVCMWQLNQTRWAARPARWAWPAGR